VRPHLDSVNSYSGEKSAREEGVTEALHTKRASLELGAPRLAEPFWYSQAHSGRWTSEKELKAAMSPDALRVYNRKRTKAARKASSATARERALALLAA
jgi:hypothetical protein